MTGSSKSTKKAALKVFGENAIALIFATCICLFAYFIIYVATGIFAFSSLQIVSVLLLLAGNLFFLLPLILGFIRFCNRAIIDQKDNPISVFYYFTNKTNYSKALFFILTFFAKTITRALLLYLPAIFVTILTTDAFYSLFNLDIPFWSSNLQPIIIGLNIIATVFFVFFLIKLYLAPCIFVIDENIDVDECFLMSKIISKKSSVDYIFLIFSFAIWIILSILWIPLIFTLPYIITAYLIHSRQAIFEYNAHVENLEQNINQKFYEGI